MSSPGPSFPISEGRARWDAGSTLPCTPPIGNELGFCTPPSRGSHASPGPGRTQPRVPATRGVFFPRGDQCPLRPEPHVAPGPRCRLPPLRPPRPWVVPDTVGPRLACGCVCRQASLPFSPTSPFARTPSFLELEERSLRKGPQSSSVSSEASVT